MLKTVSLQAIVSFGVALIALVLGGANAGLSALLGGAVCVVPNGIFALRLTWQARQAGGANVATFLIGEFVKLGLTITLLVVVATQCRHLNWLAFIAGLIVTLKSYVVLFVVDRNS
jgi:ATP synthase protein I